MPPKTLRQLLREYERNIVVATLQKNVTRERAAQALGLSLRGLERVLVRHGLARCRYSRRLPFTVEDLNGQHNDPEPHASGALAESPDSR